MKLKRKTATVEMADGTVHQVRVINPDLLRYRETAQKHRWPTMTVKDGAGTVPILDYEDTFVAWAALRRLDLYTGTWEEFKDRDCLGVEVEEEEVDPTGPAPAGPTPDPVNGSSSSSPTSPDSTPVG